jgi:glycosyltransferase involved in cell wall biosynthesis
MGGAEKFVFDITRYSSKEKFEHEICFLSEGGVFARKIEENNIDVYYMKMKGGYSIIHAFKLRKLLNKIKPNVIHSHTRNYLINLIILFYPYIYKIYFEHGGGRREDILSKSKKLRLFYYLFGRFYNTILVNSNYVRNKIVNFRCIDEKKLKVFYIGIDPDSYILKDKERSSRLKNDLGIPKTNNVIGMVGVLSEQKGLDDFIKVLSEIKKINEKVSFIVVGDGDKKQIIEEMALKNNLAVLFLGERQDIPHILSIFDVFLMTSKWEPFGITVIEALAAKVPVVGFSVPGMKEIIEKGGGGILIKERDYKKIAEIVIKLLNNRNEYDKLVSCGYSNVRENFDIKKIIKELEQYYSLGINN